MAFVEADGVKLYFEEVGQGPAILFLHEFAAELRSWRSQFEHLQQGYRCIAFNARGYPPSDVPADANAYGEERSVRDVICILDALGWMSPTWSEQAWARRSLCTLHCAIRSGLVA